MTLPTSFPFRIAEAVDIFAADGKLRASAPSQSLPLDQ
jgi:hypothetical protein